MGNERQIEDFVVHHAVLQGGGGVAVGVRGDSKRTTTSCGLATSARLASGPYLMAATGAAGETSFAFCLLPNGGRDRCNVVAVYLANNFIQLSEIWYTNGEPR